MSTRTRMFISYRRDETANEAKRLLESLRSYFHETALFLDSASIAPGSIWADSLLEALNESAIVLVLIGRAWISGTGHRLGEADDWVRREIDIALRDSEVMVIPVVLDDTPIPATKDLPDVLQKLPMIQALRLSRASWDDDVFKLAQQVLRLGSVRSRTVSPDEMELLIEQTPRRYVDMIPTLVGGAIGAVVIAILVAWLVHWAGGDWLYTGAAAAHVFVPIAIGAAAEVGRGWKAGDFQGLGPIPTLVASKIYRDVSTHFDEPKIFIPIAFFVATAILLYGIKLSSGFALLGSLGVELAMAGMLVAFPDKFV